MLEGRQLYGVGRKDILCRENSNELTQGLAETQGLLQAQTASRVLLLRDPKGQDPKEKEKGKAGGYILYQGQSVVRRVLQMQRWSWETRCLLGIKASEGRESVTGQGEKWNHSTGPTKRPPPWWGPPSSS